MRMEINLGIEWPAKPGFAPIIQWCGIHEFPHGENILATSVFRIRFFLCFQNPDPHFLGS